MIFGIFRKTGYCLTSNKAAPHSKSCSGDMVNYQTVVVMTAWQAQQAHPTPKQTRPCLQFKHINSPPKAHPKPGPTPPSLPTNNHTPTSNQPTTMARLVKLTVALLAAALVRAQDDGGNPDEIIGGSTVPTDSVPWIGSLQTTSGFHLCGCSLIRPNVVITAAHCVSDGSTGFVVRLGTTDLASGRGTTAIPTRVFVHPTYNARDLYDDIAIIELSKPVEGITPIELDTSSDSWQGGSGRILGWGRTSYRGNSPKQMQYADVPIVSDAECSQVAPFDELLKPTQVCIGYRDGWRGGCNGDSGGPLTVGSTLVGLTSYGRRGCSTYGAYTQVNQYKSYIDSILARINPPSDVKTQPPTPEDNCVCDAMDVQEAKYCDTWLDQDFTWCYADKPCPGSKPSRRYPTGKVWFECTPGLSSKAQALADAISFGKVYQSPSEGVKEFGTAVSGSESAAISPMAAGLIGAGATGLGCAVLFLSQRKRSVQQVTNAIEAIEAERVASDQKMASHQSGFDI
jgi:trypsin